MQSVREIGLWSWRSPAKLSAIAYATLDKGSIHPPQKRTGSLRFWTYNVSLYVSLPSEVPVFTWLNLNLPFNPSNHAHRTGRPMPVSPSTCVPRIENRPPLFLKHASIYNKCMYMYVHCMNDGDSIQTHLYRSSKIVCVVQIKHANIWQ
jgi:hypothetical protein